MTPSTRRQLLATAALAAATWCTSAWAAEPIKIANIVELSGAGATSGTNFKNGVELAVKEIKMARCAPDDWLLLTDTPGATPHNAALRLASAQVQVLSGVSVPMLWRTLCYAGLKPPDRTDPTCCPRRRDRHRCHALLACGRMITTTLTISNKLGLHARASAKLTKLAGSFQCEVFMSRNGRRVNAKSIMGVMMLAAGIGATVELETEGEDEQAAQAAITALVNDKFGEGQ